MTSADQLELSPSRLESASEQLANDAREARSTADVMSLAGSELGDPEVGIGVRAALVGLGRAYDDGFTTVANELDGLAAQVMSTARLAVLVDNNAAGHFTPSDAI
jgi:hypothetical protein